MTKKQVRNIIFAIILGTFLIYQIIDSIDYIKERESKKTEWTQERIENLLIKMETELINQSPELKRFPEIVSEYSDCCIDTLIKHFNFQQYLDFGEIPSEKQFDLLIPIISNCLDSFKRNMGSNLDSIIFSRNLKSCAKRASETGNLDSLQAIKYCNCYLKYIESKYGKIEDLNIDSILSIEKEKKEECIQNAIE